MRQFRKCALRCSTAVFIRLHNHGENIDSPQHTEDSAGVETVDFSSQKGAKEH